MLDGEPGRHYPAGSPGVCPGHSPAFTMPRSSPLLGALLLIVAPTASSCGSESGLGEGTASTQPTPCPAYTEIEIQGQPTGLVRCSNGNVARLLALACPVALEGETQCSSTGASATCQKDADCAERPHGYCGNVVAESPSCHCSYGCVTDADCSAGQICRCGEPTGVCMAASCATDADCPGQRCVEYGNRQNPCSDRGWACTTPLDTCAGDSSCLAAPDPASAAACRPGAGGSWACVSEPVCVSGRPLVVAQTVRVAALQGGLAWA